MTDINFNKIISYAKEVTKGTKHLERLCKEEEQGRIKGSTRNVEASILLGASKGTDGEVPGREEQLDLLKVYAKASGCWFEDYYEVYPIESKISQKTESEVFYDTGYVIKVNNFSQHEDICELFDRIAIQNIMFPELYYLLIGFTEREGEVNAIMKQPFIKMMNDINSNIIKPTQEEVSFEMGKRGFVDRGGNMYTTENYIVEDLHKQNVCYSEKGNFMFFDPVIRLNFEGEGYDGIRNLGEIDIEG